MKTVPHYIVMQRGIERQQAHALMVGHIGINDDARFSIPAIFAAEIDRFVETHRAVQIEGRQAAQVVESSFGIDGQRQHTRIRRDNQIVFEARFQGEVRHAECLVLINLIGVESAVCGFRDAPRDAFLVPVSDLLHHGVAALARSLPRARAPADL